MKRFLSIAVLIILSSAVFADTRFHERSYEAEQALSEWAKKAQFSYGYQSENDISHYFPLIEVASQAKAVPSQEMTKLFDSFSLDVVKELYVEMYGNLVAIKYMISYYKEKKDWRHYNVLVKKVEPGTTQIFYQIQNYVKSSSRCSALAADQKILADSRKRALLCQRERLTIVDSNP